MKTFSRTRVEGWPLDAIGPVTARSFTNGGMVDAELIRIKPSFASNRVLVRMGHTQRITTQARPGQARFGGKGTPVCAVGHVESNKRCGHLLSLADEYECDENATDPNTGKCVDPPIRLKSQFAATYRSSGGDSGGAVYSGHTAWAINWSGEGSPPSYSTPIFSITNMFPGFKVYGTR